MDYPDLGHGSTCFNEATGDGLFPVLEKVLNSRESLALDCTDTLTRITPRIATMEGCDLQRKHSNCGKERFITEKWLSVMKQKLMKEIQDGTRKKSNKSDNK